MHFLITAGGTREYIDPIRFISNASSGKMGYALARAALRAGHKVTLISAPTALREPAGAKVVKVETAAEMFEAVKKHFKRSDCLIMAAAVADYTPARPAKTKLKKTADSLTLKLIPTADILKWADAISFFDTNLAQYALRHSGSEIRHRIGWGLNRLPHQLRSLVSDMKFADPGLQRLVQSELSKMNERA